VDVCSTNSLKPCVLRTCLKSLVLYGLHISTRKAICNPCLHWAMLRLLSSIRKTPLLGRRASSSLIRRRLLGVVVRDYIKRSRAIGGFGCSDRQYFLHSISTYTDTVLQHACLHKHRRRLPICSTMHYQALHWIQQYIPFSWNREAV
jgi:hypothetical protein